MGAETAAAAGIVGASALFGASESRRAGKRARRQVRAQEAALAEDRKKLATDQQMLSKQVEKQQRKLAAGQARSARSRLRGGVFGEAEPTTRTLNPTLG